MSSTMPAPAVREAFFETGLEILADQGFGGLKLAELCRRIDLSRVNRRVLEALIKAGAMDGLGANRATLLAALDAAVQGGEQATRASAAGQDDLFGGGQAAEVEPQVLPEWTERIRLANERETLGAYLSGHPMDIYEAELPRLVSARLGDLAREPAPTSGEARGGLFQQVIRLAEDEPHVTPPQRLHQG